MTVNAHVSDFVKKARSRTIWQAFTDSAALVPTKDALVAADDSGSVRRLSYSELVTRATNFSAGLARIGVRRGDRVVLWSTNTPEWVIAYLGIMRLGAAVVPINTFLKPPEVRYLIAQSGARHLIMLDRFRKLNLPELLEAICPEFATADAPGHLMSDDLPELKQVVVINRSNGPKSPGAYDFAELERDVSEGDLQVAAQMESRVRPTELGLVKYTSGSMGFPKGVMLEQAGIIWNAMAHSRQVGVDGADRFFSMMPFFHGGGSIWGLQTMLVNGGTLIFTEAFNASLAARLIEQEQATVMFGVLPEEVAQAGFDEGHDFSSLRIAPRRTPKAQKAFVNATFEIWPFGLTESYGPAAVTSPSDPKEKLAASCGRLLEGNELKVIDPDTGFEVPTGVVGEALLRGNIMRGYWNLPAETAKAIDDEGWMHSEDLVSVDGEGYLTYVGRRKLMLKVGGENVSLEEVESVIESHEAIAAACAVGVVDDRKDEVVRAYVVTKTGIELDIPALHAWLSERVAGFKMPREIIELSELPTLGSGKIDRVALTARAASEDVIAQGTMATR
jgi:fatty-acyl-CoA synthase